MGCGASRPTRPASRVDGRLLLELESAYSVIEKQRRGLSDAFDVISNQKRELQKERDATKWSATECVICMDSSIDAILWPCAHACVCHDCGARVKACPMCRKPVRTCARIFVPACDSSARRQAPLAFVQNLSNTIG